jgi:preprotein translocase subunit SecG
MQPPYHEPVIQGKPSKKNKTFGRIIKIMAFVLLILSIVFIILGLMPQTKYEVSKPLQPVEVGSSHAVDLEKGEILVLDYSVEGKDAAFYLTYGDPWDPGNGDYIEKKDHASIDHFEIEAENSGLHYLNFQSNDPSSHGTFQVDLHYKVMSRFTPTYIILGITFLIVGLGLALFYLWWKKKPHMLGDEYIRL